MLNSLSPKVRTLATLLFLFSSLLLLASSCGQATIAPLQPTDTTTQPIFLQNNVSTILDAVKTKRKRSYTAVQQLQYLEDNNMLPDPSQGAYYSNGYDFYTNKVRVEFNNWLSNIESEFSLGNTINNYNDKALEYQAFQDNESFVEWAQAVYDYFTVHSGGTGVVPGHNGGYLSVQTRAGEPSATIEEVAKDAVKEFTKEELDKAMEEIKKEIIKEGIQFTVTFPQLESAKWDTWLKVILG